MVSESSSSSSESPRDTADQPPSIEQDGPDSESTDNNAEVAIVVSEQAPVTDGMHSRNDSELNAEEVDEGPGLEVKSEDLSPAGTESEHHDPAVGIEISGNSPGTEEVKTMMKSAVAKRSGTSSVAPVLGMVKPEEVLLEPLNQAASSKPVVPTYDRQTMAKQARALAKLDRLGAGQKSAMQATMRDIGALGIGMQLYFMLTKYLSIAFFLMGLISLPALIVNKFGHGLTSKTVDPLQLGYASLGNQGVSDDIVNSTSLCLPTGDIDCTWDTVNTPFTSDPVKVSWIITISDCAYSVFFVFFYIIYRIQARKAIDLHQNENLTPAKYAVFVRGLPSDATEKEILSHFNSLYDLTKPEEYCPLWLGFWWGRRRPVRHSLSRKAVNRNVVTNVDHLAGPTSVNKELYLNTWIAEVSVGHPTGGLLRTFLSMQALTQRLAETRSLIRTLGQEKKESLTAFPPADEKLFHKSVKLVEKLETALERSKRKIKALQHVVPLNEADLRTSQTGKAKFATKREHARAKVAAAAQKAAQKAATTQRAFDWEACDCAFVVFNNLESRRRCLIDYRHSVHWLPRRFQPPILRFRNGKYPLIVLPAPEPSNILWENLEVTDRGRFYRRSLTNFITFLLLLLSAIIISAAQSAQTQYKSKLPPAGLCDSSLPEVFYGNNSYSSKIDWTLDWNSSATCDPATDGTKRYHIAYTNGIANSVIPTVSGSSSLNRCLDPCTSSTNDTVCSTMPCFVQSLANSGQSCQTYLASHVLYCYCSSELTDAITSKGYVNGPKSLWDDQIPCRGYITDYLKKNGFIIAAAAVVVIVNTLLNMILRAFATFERHVSESSKASAIAVKMFGAQFLNTAIIVIIVNAALGLSNVPVVNQLLKGSYSDFQRGWYPAVGMAITTTMLINVLTPQLVLFLQMFVIAPIRRRLQARSARTQGQMNRLYAGPAFDISQRYPMILNSVFVTMAFCGGSPILLFIASITAAATYWFDKLSIVHLYSVTTAYDEELGETAISVLPWSLVLHLAVSTWMYGNASLMKATMIDMIWFLDTVGLHSIVKEHVNATSQELYTYFLNEASSIDVLGQHGLLVKIVRANDMLIFLFFVGVVVCLLLSTIWLQMLWPLVKRFGSLLSHILCGWRSPPSETREKKTKKVAIPVVLPEFTDVFRKSVKPAFQPDRLLGFQKNPNLNTELICLWQEDTTRNGIERMKGERKLTWEAMQAPVRTYAIEANEKYRLAAAEIAQAAKVIRDNRALLAGKVKPILDDEAPVAQAVNATEAVASSEEPVDHSAIDAAITMTQPEPIEHESYTDGDDEEAAEDAQDDAAEVEQEGEIDSMA